MGGSAPAMANQIAEGYTLLTAVQLKRLTDPEMDLLLFELEKILRDARGEQVDLEDIPALQVRNRKLSRIQNAIMQINMAAQRRRRGA
jgi:predicted lipid-binding transport protein (Tim44 family)